MSMQTSDPCPSTATTPDPTTPSAGRRPLTGLRFEVADSADAVAEAWTFVHRQYATQGLIREQPGGIHVEPGAVGPGTVVVLGRLSGLVVSTTTLMADESGTKPLPADRRFPVEMATVRADGGRVMEIGLFADRRSADIDRTFGTVVELMRFATQYAGHAQAATLICAVPATRARLFGRAFGFRAAGAPKPVPVFGGIESVLMIADCRAVSGNDTGSRTLAYLMEERIPPRMFEGRFRFREEELRGSRLGAAIGRAAQGAGTVTDVPVVRAGSAVKGAA